MNKPEKAYTSCEAFKTASALAWWEKAPYNAQRTENELINFGDFASVA